jgi:hypothetical protein
MPLDENAGRAECDDSPFFARGMHGTHDACAGLAPTRMNKVRTKQERNPAAGMIIDGRTRIEFASRALHPGDAISLCTALRISVMAISVPHLHVSNSVNGHFGKMESDPSECNSLLPSQCHDYDPHAIQKVIYTNQNPPSMHDSRPCLACTHLSDTDVLWSHPSRHL